MVNSHIVACQLSLLAFCRCFPSFDLDQVGNIRPSTYHQTFRCPFQKTDLELQIKRDHPQSQSALT